MTGQGGGSQKFEVTTAASTQRGYVSPSRSMKLFEWVESVSCEWSIWDEATSPD